MLEEDVDVQRSVLILDDDPLFRGLVADILRVRGVPVVGARSAREASELVMYGDPLVAIVDYRLGESDGISWITRIRENGRKFPIVFLSGTWCDEKTFSWLRNILKVSLILTKPIEPSLFLHQIEQFLPSSGSNQETTWIMPAAGTHTTDQQQDENSQDSSDPVTAREQHQARIASKVNSKLNKARATYAKTLTQQWEELSRAATEAENYPNNQEKCKAVEQTAHKLYGTSGSLGFTKVSQWAGKIEELLRNYDPLDPLREVIWSEVNRALDSGAEEVLIAAAPDAEKEEEEEQKLELLAAKNSVQSPKILVLGPKGEDSNAASQALHTMQMYDIDWFEDIDSAINSAASSQYDSAVLDLGSRPLNQILKLGEALRSNHTIPLAAVSAESDGLSKTELLYAGFSSTRADRPNKDELEAIIENLTGLRDQQKPRVLSVDDDQPLTDYITQILTKHNMNVRGLNKPIAILETLQDFKPDLLLLDVMMPGLSGFDLCRMLRATEAWGDLPIIFLTARSDEQGRAAAFQSGGTDFLIKPVLAEELVARVRAHLDHARMTQGQPQKDLLTGLMTGDNLIAIFGEFIQQATEAEQSVSLCLLGVTGFSKLTMENGWKSGEDVLRAMANLLQRRYRSHDLRAELGQDGFAIVLQNVEKHEAAGSLELLRQDLSELVFRGDSGNTFRAEFTAGIAEFPSDGQNMQTVLVCANQRLMANN